MRERILVGDARERLADIEPGSVQTCITSPPYFGLRDYGTASWDGGDPACDHVVSEIRTGADLRESPASNRGGVLKAKEVPKLMARVTCPHCGALRIDAQIGLEGTPAAYVTQMVEVFRMVRDLLADDGTLWLNLGDSYAGGGHGARDAQMWPKQSRNDHMPKVRNYSTGFKPKDLIGIPWRVAFALQEDGWWLRSEIIWAKPNPMPESVTDRPTKSHEHIFLLSKSRRYYYDYEAIREPDSGQDHRRTNIVPPEPSGGVMHPHTGLRTPDGRSGQGRNKRDVWTVATKPFLNAHFAVMPEALVEPCILAGSHPGDTVLDPFAGSGTVGVVAKRFERDFIGCELNPEYAEMARARIAGQHEPLPIFAAEGPAA